MMRHLRHTSVPTSPAAAGDFGDLLLSLLGLPARDLTAESDAAEIFRWADDGGWLGEE
ncbi:hypothetical protein [Tabrizicola sp.]|uniref:hypothetical protein n=1 Tax=Tabrizicola sp. TaxID=2005166 RepID=UPI003F674070